MRAIKKMIPLWIKATISVFITEIGRWPINIVLVHMWRSFAQNGGCGEKGKRRAERAVQKATYAWLKKQYGHLAADISHNYSVGEPVQNAPIWVFWWQGVQNAPTIVQRCIASIIANAGNHPVRIVDQSNYQQYVTVPDYIEKKRRNGNITLTHFSDYLRMALLANHGGLWLDATIYATGNMQQAFREPVFTVRNPEADDPNISGWNWSGFAFGCQKQFALPCLVLDLFDAYWKDYDYLIEYFLIDYMIRLIYDSNSLVHQCIVDIPRNNAGLYFYQKNFNLPAEDETPPAGTWLFKLSWKRQYNTHTESGLETIYQRWLYETEGILCRK